MSKDAHPSSLLFLFLFLALQLFVVRELSANMDLETYDKMLAIQHNPKFAHYFAAPAGGGMATS